MYCQKCGKKTEAGGKFCPWCGGEIVPPEPPRRILVRKGGGVATEIHGGFVRRFAAAIIDLIFILLIAAFATGLFGLSEGARMMYQAARHLPVTTRDGEVVQAAIPVPVVVTIMVIIILIPWLYFAVLESSKNQGTLGKIALRLAVTDHSGRRLTFSRATLRFFSKFVSAIVIFMGFFAIGVTKRKQGFHDYIAGTYVFHQAEN
ncbi:MAG: RDD family protein [Methanomicrobiales archaeon]|nr:RDD family protein [Methanomicrobiales archaeon]